MSRPLVNVSSWLVCYEPRPDALVRLFCFPHGGGGPHAFRTWASQFDTNVEVFSVSLPGRGARQHEPNIMDMKVLASEISVALLPYLDKPYAVFGHSVGALLCHEVAQKLQQMRVLPPLHVFLSSHTAPHLAKVEDDQAMYQLSDSDLVKIICKLGLVPADAMENEDLVQILLPPIRADFAISETYKFVDLAPLAVNLAVMGGVKDEILTHDDLESWKTYTSKDFTIKTFNGGHFYTQTHQNKVLSYMGEMLMVDLKNLPASVMIGAKEPYPYDKCLHDLFREQAVKTPDEIAIVDIHKKLTFRELDKQSDLLACYLRYKGAGVNKAIGIYMERCVEYVIAYLAILKAGGGYLPIETAYPLMLLEKTIRTAKPVAVLTKRKFYNNLPDEVKVPNDRSFCVDDDWEKVLQQKQLPRLEDNGEVHHPDMAAYFIMTSGTTGVPKGIRCPHRGAVNSYYWRYNHYPYDGVEREASNVFFVWEIIRPILQGSTGYVIPDDVIYDPRRLVDFLSEHKINRVLFTPSLLEQIMHTPKLNLKERLPDLTMVYLNGEVVTMSLRKKFFKHVPGVKLINDYSISECHDVCTYDLADVDEVISHRYCPIGEPMSNVNIYVLDEQLKPVPRGCKGEIFVGGDSVALDYLNLPEKTAERFLKDNITNSGTNGNGNMFRTGDGGRILPNGHLEVTGRIQFMIKLRGYSIVPDAVAAAISEHPGVHAAIVHPELNKKTEQPEFMVGYFVGNGRIPNEALMKQLRPFLKDRVPHYAVPSYFVPLDALPIEKTTGKVNLKKLPKFKEFQALIETPSRSPPKSEMELKIVEAWKAVLGKEPLDLTDNFFDLGGHSLLAIQMVERLSGSLGITVSVVDIFEHPTVEAFAKFVGRMAGPQDAQRKQFLTKKKVTNGATEIAIIGTSCRFPKANNEEEFWSLLANGGCAIRQFTEHDLREIGIPESVFKDANYVKAGAILDNVDQFDFRFWGISEKEAKLMDPQHRLFLQCAWEALENAGYAPQQSGHRTGIFAGTYLPSYLLHYLKGGGLVNLSDPTGFHMTETGNDKDYLTTRASYLLNCNGPSIAIQTSCSTSLVAVATACQFLLSNQCDMAIAGASSITFPQGGYQYQEGHVLSPDGQCRAFDAKANGTILGDGVGILVMKRLEDAIADGDHIRAVVKGFAINNDGSAKGGYSSPSVKGQMQVIAEAQEMAKVSPDSITYVEGHGTGTLIGDPIEVRALTQVFRESTEKKQFCCLGSVKPNIGHCNIAAGMAGLFKVILSFQHRQIAPTLNFTQPNPNMHLEDTPFFISNKINHWNTGQGQKRRAGISCFGIGGTNCHMILEEPPENAKLGDKNKEVARSQYLLTLSAKSAVAVDEVKSKLLDFLKKLEDKPAKKLKLKNIAYTLHVGREQFKHRIAVACHDIPSAIESLQAAKNVERQQRRGRNLKMVFMFPGQGSQYVQMGRSIYNMEDRYRHYFDQCADILREEFDIDIRSIVFADRVNDDTTSKLNKAYHLQPAMFTVEYALAKMLIDWGIQPDGVMGHSIGEYSAACLAGIFDLKDALSLVVTRAYAMEDAISGNMLSVSMTEENAQIFVQQYKGLWLSVVNSPTDVVFGGHGESISKAETALNNVGVLCRRVHVSRAFHCPMMTDASEKLLEKAKQVTLRKPQIPIMANLTGTWLTDEEALDPSYWSKQMTNQVRFATNVENVLMESPEFMVEVGPSRTLRTLVSRFLKSTPIEQQPLSLSTMPHPRELELSDSFLYRTLAQLWSAGVDIDWASFHKGEILSRVPIPTYSFTKRHCWPDNVQTVGLGPQSKLENTLLPVSDRFHIPSFARSSAPVIAKSAPTNWLLFMESDGPARQLSEQIAEKLASAGNTVQRVYRSTLSSNNGNFLSLRPGDQAEYEQLFKQLMEDNRYPDNILYLWSLMDSSNFNSHQPINVYYHMLYLAKTLSNHTTKGLNLWILTQQMLQVNQEVVNPVMATILGPAIVLPQENPQMSCRVLDVQISQNNITYLGNQILKECLAGNTDPHHLVALRGRNRWVERFEEAQLSAELREQGAAVFKQGGVYIITGGLGRIGLTLAHWLSKLNCKVIISTRSDFACKDQWEILENDNKTPEKLRTTIEALNVMEQIGGDINVVQVDMGKPRDAVRLINNTTDKYGKIDGIFHAAGLADLKYLEQLTYDISEKEFEPKVYGVLNLHEALGDLCDELKPDFVILFSSMASILGGYGMTAYAAANRFMDTFVQTLADDTTNWVSVNFDDWQFEYTKEQTAAYQKSVKDLAMSPEEGIDSIERILAISNDHSQILVSTRPLQPRVERWLHQRYVDAKIEKPQLSIAPPSLETPESSAIHRQQPTIKDKLSIMERDLAQIYKEVLGVSEFTVDDNFYDLGGDSLLAAQIMLQIQRRIQSPRKIQLRIILECATVKLLSEWLAQPVAA